MEAQTLQRAGWQVDVVCPVSAEHPRRRETLDGIRIHRFPLPLEGRRSIGTLVEYAIALTWISLLSVRIALRARVEVVQICNPPDILFVPALLAKLLRRSQIIFDHHDLCPELWEAKGGSPKSFYGRALAFAEKLTFRSADAVISTNESYRQVALERGSKHPEVVTVVRSGPPRSFAASPLPATREISEEGRLAYLGTMGVQEGVDILLESVKLLREELGFPGIRLDLVGAGPEVGALQSLSDELGLADNVTFHGRVPDEPMREILLQADIGVNPDRPNALNNLSTMNKIIEYMALGLPVVQFEAIEGRRSALDASIYVAEPTARGLAAGIRGLLRDRDKREAMRHFGHDRFLADLCWETQEEYLLRAYDGVMGPNGD